MLMSPDNTIENDISRRAWRTWASLKSYHYCRWRRKRNNPASSDSSDFSLWQAFYRRTSVLATVCGNGMCGRNIRRKFEK